MKIKNQSGFRVRVKASLWFGSAAVGEHKFSKRYLGNSQDTKRNFMSSSFPHSSLHLTGGGSLKMLVTIKLYDEVSPNHVLDLDLAAMKEETQELSKQVKLLAASIASMKVSSGLSLECPVCYEEVKPPMRLKHCAQVTMVYRAKYVV